MEADTCTDYKTVGVGGKGVRGSRGMLSDQKNIELHCSHSAGISAGLVGSDFS